MSSEGGRHWESSLVQAIITFEVGFEQKVQQCLAVARYSHVLEEGLALGSAACVLTHRPSACLATLNSLLCSIPLLSFLFHEHFRLIQSRRASHARINLAASPDHQCDSANRRKQKETKGMIQYEPESDTVYGE